MTHRPGRKYSNKWGKKGKVRGEREVQTDSVMHSASELTMLEQAPFFCATTAKIESVHFYVLNGQIAL